MCPLALNVGFQLLCIACLCSFLTAAAIVTLPGQIATIPAWHVQSSRQIGNDQSKLSDPGLDTSSWYKIGTRGTLMATLLENNVYKEKEIFYSTNLKKVTPTRFSVPWFYRAKLDLKPGNGSYYQLRTHGISSSADIYLNGVLVAGRNTQAGSYTGLELDLTGLVKAGNNILLIRAYPTDYNRDLALGFVDWNPYPPDNGTGVWRDVEVKQSGGASLSLPRVVALADRYEKNANISVRVGVKNLKNSTLRGEVACTVLDPSGTELGHPKAEFVLEARAQRKIWWPKQWGAQPLYSTVCTASIGAEVSDKTSKIRFGIRSVTSTLSSSNDTTFFINGKRFQVVGAGYTSDMFLRFDAEKIRTQFQYMLDMGMNTVRLEGKQEHPYLYELADELGLMVMTGWECCDKWEGWTYNDEGSGEKWTDRDYTIANSSMRHEAEMMQHHPSLLAFLVGSDFWPDDRATKIYVDALEAFDWNIPIISSASQRGFPAQLGNGGMKMEGPYDWVPPSYWYDDQNRLGSAAGFASELGAGAGTPELSSLKKFLSPADLEDLWKNPKKGLYHMSTEVSQFYTREIYNAALWARYGAPTSLDDYLMKAQMMDYEATRSQFEAYAARWNTQRPATGLIYWMLNNAWPSLHWNLFDYYLHPWGSYYGAKIASRDEHVVFDPVGNSVYLINRQIDRAGQRTVDFEIISLNGTILSRNSFSGPTEPSSAKFVGSLPGLSGIEEVVLLRLVLHDRKETLSRNVYWISGKTDVLDWDKSTWYYTPTTAFADYKALDGVARANVTLTQHGTAVELTNTAKVPAIFVRLNLLNEAGNDAVPVLWSDNYITLWPGEKITIDIGNGGKLKGGTRSQSWAHNRAVT
ncbi:glycoside hydrolase family 2 protein [Aaosphaeria arxii CBS 175.79]|uniref:Glycoside hydrolase family 2 protein n=1 Tax=Aaosphaeria arxii CBS 175.79 TaxID=1450172 RepID=A0A6A5Y8M6_9PLEO|nr:glycoside hydrolase family 2 protein [Aaosphaeria arxii CBS 175.79]KAF2021170.1 glycoside hydrolase family 2 protein [Aaosphaeria arxii CBS 175.79]